MALSSLEIIMLIANVVLIIIAIFLLIRLRKIEKKPESEIKQQAELSGIRDIIPMEFNRERFGIGEREIPKPEKTMEAGEEEKIEASKIADLKLEDELPEVEEAPRKKRTAKKQEKKAPEEAVAEKSEVPHGKIEIPEKIEFKFEETEPEKEEEKTEKKPEKKESEKKKPVKKEPAAKKETKPAPRKKPAKKKKSLIGENI